MAIICSLLAWLMAVHGQIDLLVTRRYLFQQYCWVEGFESGLQIETNQIKFDCVIKNHG